MQEAGEVGCDLGDDVEKRTWRGDSSDFLAAALVELFLRIPF